MSVGGVGSVELLFEGRKSGAIYYAGSSAPGDTRLLWIDTTADTGGLRYYDGSAWSIVPVSYV